MPRSEGRHVLSDLTVKDAMRRQVVMLPTSASISAAIRQLLKFKVNAALITGEYDAPVGVVSKTDIVGAYYAELPLDSPLEHIMMAPPLFCGQSWTLEAALDTMRSQGIYRLYVVEEDEQRVIGLLAYPDIVGLLYRYCRSCDRSIVNRKRKNPDIDDETRLRVKDVMHASVVWYSERDGLTAIMEGMAAQRVGAALIKDSLGHPRSVISKTDLILAYQREVPQEAEAGTILASARVISCEEDTFLEVAIGTMILSDLQRLFVFRENPDTMTGVLSLSDATRLRSGSCHACVSSRIKVE